MNFFRRKLALQGGQHRPFLFGQARRLDDDHRRGLLRFRARLDIFPPHVPDAEGEDAFRRHETEMFRADNLGKNFAVALQRKTVRHFQRRPELVFRTRRDRVGRTQHDMAGKRVALRHVIEGGVDFFRRHFPGDERAIGQVGREQRLAHPAHRAGAQHGGDPLAARSRPAAPERSAISANGSRTKPAILSSEMARMRALTGSLCSTGRVSLGKVIRRRRRKKRRENGRPCRAGQTNARRNECSGVRLLTKKKTPPV